MFKLLGRKFNSLEDLWGTVRFFKYNPHSIPGINKMLCKMGRHDFMPVSADETLDKKKQVLLECFYCEQAKRCTFDNRI